MAQKNFLQFFLKNIFGEKKLLNVSFNKKFQSSQKGSEVHCFGRQTVTFPQNRFFGRFLTAMKTFNFEKNNWSFSLQ